MYNNRAGRQQALQDHIDLLYGSKAKIVDWKNGYYDLLFTIDNGDGTFTEAKASIDNLGTSITETHGDTKKFKSGIETFVDSVKGKMKSLSSYFTAMFGVQEIIQFVRQGVQSVKEIDTALTELKKVTNETNTVYNEFLQTASKTAKVVGSTVSDFVSATADFARLGYDITEASELAKAASVYKNVGDGIDDISQASESIISTMKAFGIEANNSMGIVDRFNEIGNNFAISSTGIGEAMQRSASALYEAGNTIDESIGLITAANSVVQNPEQVGTALKTLALRLRGAKVELEEAGLEADNMAESTSTLQAKLLALTHGKVDIMLDADTFKNTTQILREMAGAWEYMTDIERAAALELMGGKRQANILSSLIKNFDTVEDVIETSINSAGSALAENEKYLDSIQGKIDQFTNSLQTMWMNFINADAVKGLVSIGTFLVDIIDKVGLLETSIISIVGYLTLIKKTDWSKFFKFNGVQKVSKDDGIHLLSGKNLTDAIKELNDAYKEGPEAFEKYKNAQKETNNGMYQMIQTTKKATYTKQDYTEALQDMTPAAQKAAQKQQMLNTAIGLGIMAATLIVSAIREYVDSLQTLEEEYDELQSSITTLKSNINSIDSELKTIQDQIDALSNKNLTLTEAEELKRLREQSDELQRQKDLQEKILEAREKQNSAKSLEMINNMLKTTAANQEKAAESGKMWGKILGGIVGTAATIAGIAVTVGTAGLGTGAGVAIAGLGLTAGSTIGGWAGEKIGSASKATENNDLIEWYNSYREAIEEANQKALEAEQKYFSNMSDKNYEKWQKKLDEVNTLQTEMYNGLEEMQEYVNNLEYSDSTRSIIDSYNDLMNRIDIEFNAGNVDAQISSIQSLQSEFYNLSRGVDENGKNVALSAEEYARYLDIVDQILAYTPSLVQGYDAEGNAILGATDARYTYNQLIAESIALLKEQQKQAAADAITDVALNEVLSSAQDNYNASIKGAIKSHDKPGTLRYNSGSMKDHGTTYDDSVWSSSDNMFELMNVIGKTRGVFESQAKYIERNIDLIIERRDEIGSRLFDSMTDKGVDEDRAKQYVDRYMSWLDTVVKTAKYAEEQANAQIRDRLYVAPQSSEYYDSLSGSQVAFINSYIGGLEGLKDESEIKIHEIRDDIIKLTNTIGQDEGAQKLIDQLFALDPSKMPVERYKESINGIFNELVDGDIITDDQRATITNQLFPDINDINKMQEQVGKKLKASSQGLVKNLTLPELRIAYKYLLEEADGSLSFAEMKQKIAEYGEELDGPIVNTYSALKQQVADFNEMLLQSSEIATDNTLVTQEYKDALIELGATEEDLAECFDSTNDLVVKNSKKLKDLTGKLKKNTAQNVKLAKSQARLKYYELFKEMQTCVDAYGNIVAGKEDEIIATYDEMNALEKVIAKYSMLEVQIVGTTTAYDKFKEAQTVDSETDYISEIEEMVLALGQAFNTAELGTEAAQAAIAGLVPESVYKDLETVDQKIAAIYNYFKKGKLSRYLTLEFDDDGNISSAEMKLENLKNFIKDGLKDQNGDGVSVFSGKDWQHFGLNQEWLDSLPKGVDRMQALADEFNTTKDIAFAFFKSLEDHDIEWLNGNYSTLLEEFVPQTLENDIYNAMNSISELNAKLAEGKIKPKEYADEFERLNKELETAKEKSREHMFGSDGVSDKTPSEIASTDIDDVDGYFEWQQKYVQITSDLKSATEDYYNALDAVNQAKKEGRDATAEEVKALEDTSTALDKASEAYDKIIEKKEDIEEPTEFEIQIAIDDINEDIADIKKDLDDKLAEGKHKITVSANGDQKSISDTESLLDACFHMDDDGYWVINAGVDKSELETKYPEILSYVDLLNSTTTLTANSNTAEAEANLQTISDTLTNIQNLLATAFKLQVDADGAITSTSKLKNLIDGIKSKTVTITQKVVKWFSGDSEATGTANVSGSAHATGTAHKSGDWGLPRAEKGSLVGELGPEMVVNPYSGRYYTVGDNGAEMVDLPKGAIIFNHLQTEQLLKNGHITSRGKMKGGSSFASGNAHAMVAVNDGGGGGGDYTTLTCARCGKKFVVLTKLASEYKWNGKYYCSDICESAAKRLIPTTGNNTTSTLNSGTSVTVSDIGSSNKNGSGGGSGNNSNDFEETFDWIEVLLEEVQEKIDLKNAKLENAVEYSEQNKIIDDIVELNQKLYDSLIDGANKYYEYANTLLNKIPEEYRAIAQDGTIAIEEFAGDADEETVKAIQDYREWIQKGADATQQAEEVLTEISNLAKQAIDNISQDFENKTSLNENKIEQLEAYNDLLETDLGFESEDIYNAIIKANNDNIAKLKQQREQMQKELNSQVEAGNIEKYSQNWYDAVNEIAAVDTEIIELTADTEDYQDAINDLHWDKFDALVERLEAVSNEAENLIDVLGNKDMVDEAGNWTDEGITALGLYAQQMEVAEVQAKKYQEEIDYLNQNWKELGYTEQEYIEKLNELKDSQYDSIKAYHDAKDAIVDLNKERIDAIKEGIEKEIDAYSELIEKKKELLDSEKDLYDFQKSIMQQEKNIADIERQLAALAGDNSASARAKKAQLEAELAEAKAELADSYYDRSVQNQQEALDKELENFQEEKDKEMEALDEYLENAEQVVSDSLTTIQANTDVVYKTLTSMGQEYGLSISESLTSPWKKGELAIQSFSEQFGISMSATVAELEALEQEFKKVMNEIEQSGVNAVNTVANNANKYTSAESKVPQNSTSTVVKPESTPVQTPVQEEPKPSLTKGSYVEVKPGTKWYSTSAGTGSSGTAKSGTIKYINEGSSHPYNINGGGWVRKQDIQGYAKGTKDLKKSGIVNVDELGEELILGAQNGRLTYLEKGSGVIPADLTSNLMEWGKLDPSIMLDANRPKVDVSPEIHNTEIKLDCSVGTLLHIEEFNGDKPEDIAKLVSKEFEKHTKNLNNALKKYTR